VNHICGVIPGRAFIGGGVEGFTAREKKGGTAKKGKKRGKEKEQSLKRGRSPAARKKKAPIRREARRKKKKKKVPESVRGRGEKTKHYRPSRIFGEWGETQKKKDY